ncbi:uncharacterized protein LOC111829911 [Capsella rubella]|uniref:uncharacterized protein LOC111829911 n=1 Tax=Capsella rubella TaxID=81985 RepID=UPI000CD4F618|nr:uncharacterized protein LOC111829911 [Capsella rubella]
MWKQLLKLRDIAKTFLSCKIGDGTSCSFWFDNWTPFGDLITFLGPEAHRRMGLPLDSTVAKARSTNGWIFRGARTNNAQLLLSHLAEIDIQLDVKDIYLWAKPNGEPQQRFNFYDTWVLCKAPSQEVSWHKQPRFMEMVLGKNENSIHKAHYLGTPPHVAAIA